MKRRLLTRALPGIVLTLASGAALAQPALTVPEASPKASVSQTVGMTDITVSYHRPAVNKRKVWGELVPWGEVWRAGANENTTISFSSPVTIGGKALPAGTYGVHMIPAQGDWTVALSNQHSAWGSFSYDAKEDAARFSATPRPADFAERLSYRFEDPTENSATLLMRWEKVELAIPITVDTKSVAVASFREQLRGLPRFGWQGWNQAANWTVRNGGDLDQALAWSDESLKIAENYQNLRVKAAILEKKGDAAGAAALRDRAAKVATEADVNQRGYGLLLGEKKVDEAIEVFKKNVKDYPNSWNVYDSLGEAYATKGDKKLAIANYSKALEMAPASQKKRIGDAIAKQRE